MININLTSKETTYEFTIHTEFNDDNIKVSVIHNTTRGEKNITISKNNKPIRLNITNNSSALDELIAVLQHIKKTMTNLCLGIKSEENHH